MTSTTDPARGSRRFFQVTVALLGVDAAVFGWAVYPELLGLPARGESTEWTSLAVTLATGVLGIILLASVVLSWLHVIYARKAPPSPLNPSPVYGTNPTELTLEMPI